jgi:hypothetical protein
MKHDALEQAKKDTEKRRRKAIREYRKIQRLIEKENLRRQIKINKDFDKLLKQEKKTATERWKREIKSTANQFRKRRKQIEINARKATREAKTWGSEIAKEEKKRRNEVLDWKVEAQKWKKESQRLRRNEKARERRAEQNRRIREGKWKGKKKFGQLQLKLEDKLSKIWGKRSKLSFTPVITDIKHAHGKTVSEYTISVTAPLTHKQVLSLSKEEVLKLIESVKKPVKVQIRLECIMEKTDPITGEVTTDSYYPSSLSIFEDFRKMAKRTYGLDPLWYYTAPGLSLDAALRFTGVELDQLMIEKGIRGGICMAVTRYAKANNIHLKDYDPRKKKSYFRYWDANNLYGCAMSEPLPVQNFKWMTEDQFENWRDYPCFLEVDLEYPKDLHDLHNDYPLAPERMKLERWIS